MEENELINKLHNSEDSTDEEEEMEENANAQRLKKDQEELEALMESRFYLFDEKKQRLALREGLKFNIRRTKSLDEFIDYERNNNYEINNNNEKKEVLKKHIRQLLLKKKSNEIPRELFRTD